MRGYTLIEIAIVLTVILMMSSFLAVNFVEFENNRRNRETARQMEIIKSAILSYAASHKTAARDLTVVNGRFAAGASVTIVSPVAPTMTIFIDSPILTLNWQLPAGRPYLPCPDITGDGYEDRIAPVAGGLTITITDGPTAGNYPLEATGGCYSSRGIVPWRTLNELGQQTTPANDIWGTRFSYRVADSFSNAITGFDQQSVADSHYRARPLFPLSRDTVRAEQFAFGEAVTVGAAGPWQGLERGLGPAVICAEAPCPRDGRTTTIIVPLVAGNFASSITMLRPVAVDFASPFNGVQVINVGDENLISGIPFVIVSHGRNGFGGVRSDTSGYNCKSFPPAPSGTRAVYWDEMQNSVWRARSTMRADSDCEETHMRFHESGFVDGINHWQDGTNYGRRQEGDNHDYDDLVVWMSAEEIIANLVTRGTLPTRLLPPIGLEKTPPDMEL